jgi:hypothetical protein
VNKIKLFLIFAIQCSLAFLHAQQLDTNCVVSILNRTAKVQKDGSYHLFNVPAGVGQARVRATCKDSTGTRYGESSSLLIRPNLGNASNSIVFQPFIRVPTNIILSTPNPLLTSVGATTQLSVIAILPDGSTKVVSPADSGTTYLSTNRAVAVIDSNGLVTAVSSGRVLMTASHEAILKTIFITVSMGTDADMDGLPNDYESAQGLNPSDPLDASLDLDGDGLTNLQEFQAGTAIRNPDTDGDGIQDGEELVAGLDGFLTNPLSSDTDGDGIRDALEIQTNSNPTDPTSINLSQALTSIDVSPKNFTLVMNSIQPREVTRQLTVTGRLRDGATLNLTDISKGTTYLSDDPDILQFGLISGQVLAVRDGRDTITVSNNGFSIRFEANVITFFPTPFSKLSLPGYTHSVDVSGKFAYIAAGSFGLHIVDISIPSLPILVSTLNTPGHAKDVKVVGNRAYIADELSLLIVDITNPASPIAQGSVTTPASNFDLFVLDSKAYLIDSLGFAIYNVSNSENPVAMGRIAYPYGNLTGVAVSGQIAVVTNGSGPVQTINVANPENPIVVGQIFTRGTDYYSSDVEVSGQTAYIAHGKAIPGGGMVIVDFSNPEIPVVVGSTLTFYNFGHVSVEGSFALANRDAGYVEAFIFDIFNPAVPAFVSSMQGSSLPICTNLHVKNGSAYLVNNEAGIPDDLTSSGELQISRFLLGNDLDSIAPTVQITSPMTEAQLIEGTTQVAHVVAHDDNSIARVEFYVNDILKEQHYTKLSWDPSVEIYGSLDAEHFEFPFIVPALGTPASIKAIVYDLSGNQTTSSLVNIQVATRPRTLVTGRILSSLGTAVNGAIVRMGADSAISNSDGSFIIPSIAIYDLKLVASAEAMINGHYERGNSDSTIGIANGTTNVGDIKIYRGGYSTDIGKSLSLTDDSYVEVNFSNGFTFPFYGTTYNTIFVNSNGNLSFNQGNYEYDPDVSALTLPTISPLWLDLVPSGEKNVYFKQYSDRIQFTWYKVRGYSVRTDFTYQVTLYPDGLIEFSYPVAFPSVSSSASAVTGLSSGNGSTLGLLDFTQEAPFTQVSPDGPYEIFNFVHNSSGRFDLGLGFLAFALNGSGNYDVINGFLPDGSLTVSIVSPTPGGIFTQGQPVNVLIDSRSNTSTPSVELIINGTELATRTNPPYQFTFIAPRLDSVDLQAKSTDIYGIVKLSAPIKIFLSPPPTTTAIGRVLDETNTPVVGAKVMVGEQVGFSDLSGNFSISQVYLWQQKIMAKAELFVNARRKLGNTDSVIAIENGITNLGDIQVERGNFSFDIGTPVNFNGSFSTPIVFPLDFAFPFFGMSYDSVFVNRKGSLTFGASDTAIFGQFNQFETGLPRIAPVWRSSLPFMVSDTNWGAKLAVRKDANLVQFTWYRADGPGNLMHEGVQAVLYPDGGIEFNYLEMHFDGKSDGTLTGLSPGTGILEGPKDLSLDSTLSIPAGSGVYEIFSEIPFHPFDLGLSSLSFELNSSGGYDYMFKSRPDRVPEASIKSPATGQRLPIGGPVNVSVQASDDVEIKSIEVLLDGVVKATVSEYTSRNYSIQTLFSLTFTAPSADSAILKIRATDVRGHVTLSDSIVLHFYVDSPPSVGILSPIVGFVGIEGDTLTLNAHAEDDFGVSNVQFLVNGNTIATLTQAPYRFIYTLPMGFSTLEIQAIGYDSSGFIGSSSPVFISVVPDPLTRLEGQVVDSVGNPVTGADIFEDSFLLGFSGEGGYFSLPNISTLKSISVTANLGDSISGFSNRYQPVRGGITNVGIIQITRNSTPGLEAYWPFNGNVLDLSEHHWDAVVQGATPTFDRFGNANRAYHFENQSEPNYISSPFGPGVGDIFTYSAWIKLDSFTTDVPFISHIMGMDSYGGMAYLRLGDAGIDNSLLQFGIHNTKLVGATHLVTNRWYHVAVTAGNGSMRIYLDGELDATGPIGSFIENSVFVIGNGFLGGDGSRGLHGSIDEVKVWNRVISQDEIRIIYHDGDWPNH